MENDNKKKGEIKKMKEIIYLDTKLVNSLLAQTDTGLLTKIIKETSNSNSTSEGKTNTTTFSTRLKAACHILGGSISKSETEAELFTQSTLVGNKDLKEAVMDDYSLEVLLKNLQEKKLIKERYKDGDIIAKNGKLSSYNFEILSKLLDFKDLTEFRREYDEYAENLKKLKNQKTNSKGYKDQIEKLDDSRVGRIQGMQKRSEYAEAMFKNTTIIKINNYISLCDNEYLRLSYPQLFFNEFSNKEFYVLGIIISKNFINNPLIESPKDSPEKAFQQMPAIFCQVLLVQNYIQTEGDYIIRPIAIYSEWD